MMSSEAFAKTRDAMIMTQSCRKTVNNQGYSELHVQARANQNKPNCYPLIK